MHRHIQETLRTHTVASAGNFASEIVLPCWIVPTDTNTHWTGMDGISCLVAHCRFFFRLTAEQLPCQQPREAAGPQVHSGPPHQYHLFQNEGTVPSFIFVKTHVMYLVFSIFVLN